MFKALTILLLPLITIGWQGDISPQAYFGDSYDEAVLYLEKNKVSFEALANFYQFDYKIAKSIVFPELIRYNRFRDFAETTALEITYVDGGKFAADFSIGYFQMKPSFVESLENIVLADSSYTVFNHIIDYKNSSDIRKVRAERLRRLKENQWQLQYLACFISIGKNRFKTVIERRPEEELLILSSLYNLSINADYEQLLQTAQNKTFPYGKFGMGRFSYYDVAKYYYDSQ